MTLFTNIGETVGKLSSKLKEIHDDIQWQSIKDFRNKVVHDYPGLDVYIVYDIVKNDLGPLKEKLFSAISTELEKGNFDREEFEIAKKSFYYRHISFEEIRPEEGEPGE